MKSLFIFAGEPSGDLHGSRLVRALRERLPGCSIAGVGGPRMRAEGIDLLMPTEKFEVMGFTDVLMALPSLWRQFYQVRDAVLTGGYDAVVLIDYPGFNLRLAKALRKKGFKGKIIQYICPTVWAHGRGRIAQMAATLDLLLTIYPFEKACFSGTPLPVAYIGNPLQEYLNNNERNPRWREKVGLSAEDEFVALFPGSRAGEIIRNLTVQLQAADRLKQSFPATRFAVSCAHPKAQGLVAEALQKTQLVLGKDVITVPKEFTYEMMDECRTAIAKSGTVTLELALRKRPTVVTYRITALNKFIAKYVLGVNLPHYCIVNILGKDTIFPEFIESELPLDAISGKLHELHVEGAHRDECMEGCRSVIRLLGDHESSRGAAKAIGDLIA